VETIRAMLKKRPDGRNHPGHVKKTPGRRKPSGPCRKNARTAETIRAMSKKRPDGGNHPGHVEKTPGR
jgi:hypothetical protein